LTVARKRIKRVRKAEGLTAATVEDRRRAGALKVDACADGGTRIRSFPGEGRTDEYDGVLKGWVGATALLPGV